MSFSESTRKKAKERSHYTCVWCQRTGQFLDVHHIKPKEDNGPDTIDNAAPLCPNCHATIGSSIKMMKQLRERRDWWWNVGAKIKTPLPDEDNAQELDDLKTAIHSIEAKGGRNETMLTELKDRLLGQLQKQITSINSALTVTQLISAVTMEASRGVVNPSIRPVSKGSIPTLFWGNNYNIKFKVWFGNNSSFSKRTSLLFSVKNPTDNEGIYTKTLTSSQWSSIRKLVGDANGSTVYWYVESLDGLGRYAKTNVMSFVFTD